ncbi:odorant receptor 131-2-like [Bufo gargarizans]|uniref:odorant receptor 131-2-like n=1 Tax=Bufo gargarizans TaxID=30331 RepID=UPI001CF5C49A|nr:odorant receptor 131-2-like [Bufo gargarizans]
MNITSIDSYVAQLTFWETKGYEILYSTFLVIASLFISSCIYLIIVLLIVFFTTPHVQENARYILFAHMLINDTLYLILAFVLSVVNMYLVYISMPICYIIVSLAVTTFKVTPYNLAVMALERYIAICFPLRHIVLCTNQRSYFVIAVLWFIGTLPHVADFIVLIVTAEKSFFSQYLLCTYDSIILKPLQSSIRSFTLITSIILVSFIIMFTYIRVTLIARKTNSKSSSASKAGRTLMLHAFQLLLSLLSLTSTFTESYKGEYVLILVAFNFLFFMCLPRLLSPLIYGLRDEVFRKCIKKMFSLKQ